MSFITPPDGWEDPSQPTIIPPRSVQQPGLPQQPQQQPPVQYIYVQQPPPPQFSQTVVVNNKSGGGCLLLFVWLCFPLWPITLPILLIVWLLRPRQQTIVVSSSSGYGTPRLNSPSSDFNFIPLVALIAFAVVAMFFAAKIIGSHSPEASRVESVTAVPKPPLRLRNSPVLTSASYGQPEMGCSAFNDRKVVVATGEHESARTSGLGWELVSLSDGTRDDYDWGDQPIPNATHKWLRNIMVPGRRLLISGNSCGSGGFESLTKVQVLDR